jgi:hypothetical protein
VFDSLEALEDQLCSALRYMENNPGVIRSIVAWSWIIEAVKK